MASGAPPFRTDAPSALPPGTRLGEFELLSLLGVGGFGIVYLAFDHALEREVAVKEYMPASLAGRTETMHVSLRSHSDAESFALGLRSFVNEAKLLARFDHPSLLKVFRFWEANGTAYMAMPVLRGRTLKEIRADMSAGPDEAWMRRMLMPLLGAIERLHSEGVYHRDIAPDNIQIEADGRPVLMDFGAARRVLSDKSQALTAILKPAYAPIEQYGEAGSVKQGPWTDLYALGATLHYMLLGRPPPPATARTVHDEASCLTTELLPGCSDTFLHTIDWMLCPRPTDRPQSVAELRHVLEGQAPPPVHRPADGATLRWERTSVLPPQVGEGRIDLDVGDQATQMISPTVPAGGVTEHVWLEPERASGITGVRPAPVDTTTVVRRGGAEAVGHPDIMADSQPMGGGGPATNPALASQPARSQLPMVLGLVAAAAVVAAVVFRPQINPPV
ncbi:MAG: serine/threonine-protein kinase, partial [Rubrivivax sp.]|nr:serine/threonine-protein kinase [Rubrivivax sp.]